MHRKANSVQTELQRERVNCRGAPLLKIKDAFYRIWLQSAWIENVYSLHVVSLYQIYLSAKTKPGTRG